MKTDVSEGLDEQHVLYSSLYTSASLPMLHWPGSRPCSVVVPTKYLFQHYSQAQSSEITYFEKRSSRYVYGFRRFGNLQMNNKQTKT